MPLDVDGGLRMKGEDVHAQIGVLGDVALRLHHHQVYVERRVGEPPEGPDQRRTEGQVRHESAIHDVDVQPLRAARQRRLHLLAQPAEVGGEQAGRDTDRHQDAFLVTTRSTRRSARGPSAGRRALLDDDAFRPSRDDSARGGPDEEADGLDPLAGLGQ